MQTHTDTGTRTKSAVCVVSSGGTEDQNFKKRSTHTLAHVPNGCIFHCTFADVLVDGPLL